MATSGWAAANPLIGCPSVLSRFFGCAVFTRLRDLITSVLSDMGLGRPWSLRKSPQALQSTEPDSSRRHNGVVEVPQFKQTGLRVNVVSNASREEAFGLSIVVSIKKPKSRKLRARR